MVRTNSGKSLFFESTTSMAMFHSYAKLPEGIVNALLMYECVHEAQLSMWSVMYGLLYA